MSLRGFGGTIRDAIPHFDGIKLRRRKSRQNLLQVQQAAAAQEPAAAAAMATTTRHRSFGSIFSFADSIKASVPRVVSRTDSVRVTRKERKTVRAQDIFFGDPTARVSRMDLQREDASSPHTMDRLSSVTPSAGGLDDCGRSVTPMTPSVLNRALLPISAPEDSETEEELDSPRDHDDSCSPQAEHKSLRSSPTKRASYNNNDVSVPEFEGYLDILSYLQRDLPEKPSTHRSRATPSPPLVQVTLKTPKEEEWMSCRSPSQSSLSNRSLSRRSVTGGGCGGGGGGGSRSSGPGSLSRTNSYNTKTVTPMSSVDSDSELRPLYTKQSARTLAESRIEEEEGSEPEFDSGSLAGDMRDLKKTPIKRASAGVMTTRATKCVHCGRDPSGPSDPEVTNSSLVTVLQALDDDDANDKARWPQVEKRRATGLSVSVRDGQGNRYLLYPETSHYEPVEETGYEHDHDGDAAAAAAALEVGFEDDLDHPLTLTPNALERARRDVAYALESDDDDYHYHHDYVKNNHNNEEEEEALKTTPPPRRAGFWREDDDDDYDEDPSDRTPRALSDPYERPYNPDPYSGLDSPSFDQLLLHGPHDHHDNNHPHHPHSAYWEEFDDDDDDRAPFADRARDLTDRCSPVQPRPPPPPTFWKDPDGVIVVYQGIEVNGRQIFYGADINYLGSFHDEEEDSSGLESVAQSPVDSVGTLGTTPTGLCVIPEISFSEEQWDEEMF